MPSQSDYVQVATQLGERLPKQRQFIRLPRIEITKILRDVSGEKRTKIGRPMGAKLDEALLGQGLRAFPTIEDTYHHDIIRLFRTGGVLATIVDIIELPGDTADKKLRSILRLDGMRDLLRE